MIVSNNIKIKRWAHQFSNRQKHLIMIAIEYVCEFKMCMLVLHFQQLVNNSSQTIFLNLNIETQYGTNQCMQSRHRMPKTNHCRRSVFACWNYATRHPERCMCQNGKDQTGHQWCPLSLGNSMQKEGWSPGTTSCIMWNFPNISKVRWCNGWLRR